jgi:hypothetical protein
MPRQNHKRGGASRHVPNNSKIAKALTCDANVIERQSKSR